MGKKGKGRQSGGFASKSLRRAHTLEWQEQAGSVRRNPHRGGKSKASTNSSPQAGKSTSSDTRPRFVRIGQLKNLLRERRLYETFTWQEQRRQGGFLPSRGQGQSSGEDVLQGLIRHPVGWMLHYGKSMSNESHAFGSIPTDSLQAKCLDVLSLYLEEYLEAMGKEELHGALSLLSTDMLASLSETQSKRKGLSNNLLDAIGNHPHVDQLCVKEATSSNGEALLTDEGLLTLVPTFSSGPSQASSDDQGSYCDELNFVSDAPTRPQETRDGENDATVVDTWEDWEDDDRNQALPYEDYDAPGGRLCGAFEQLSGCSIRLKRLELVDCPSLSAAAILALLERCAGITHLSLAGSIEVIPDGIEVIQSLPEKLPCLQVLDVSRCEWMSQELLQYLHYAYATTYTDRKPPIVHCQAFLANSNDNTMPLSEQDEW